jgi:hypothetical protein
MGAARDFALDSAAVMVDVSSCGIMLALVGYWGGRVLGTEMVI